MKIHDWRCNSRAIAHQKTIFSNAFGLTFGPWNQLAHPGLFQKSVWSFTSVKRKQLCTTIILPSHFQLPLYCESHISAGLTIISKVKVFSKVDQNLRPRSQCQIWYNVNLQFNQQQKTVGNFHTFATHYRTGTDYHPTLQKRSHLRSSSLRWQRQTKPLQYCFYPVFKFLHAHTKLAEYSTHWRRPDSGRRRSEMSCHKEIHMKYQSPISYGF